MLLLALGIIALTLIWLKIKKTFSYFRSHGIAEDPGYFPFGSKATWKMMFTKISFLQMTDQIYAEFPNEKIVGTYGPLGKRTIVIRDMDIVRKVLIKDFDHFVDRRHLIANRKANKYFMDMLTTMNGDKWKEMRTIISPVFTSGKLKTMMPIIHRVGDEFVDFLKTYAKDGIEFDAKDVMTSYTLNVISSAGLGIEANAFNDRNGLLRKRVDMLVGANNSDPFGTIRILLIVAFPKLMNLLNLPVLNKTAMDFIAEVIKSSVEMRVKTKEKKNDLIDIMIETLNNYKEEAKKDKKNSKRSFTEEEIESALISNALLLFFAGFDTSSNGMSLVSYFLARNKDVQQKLYIEIEEAISKNNGNQKLDYNVVQEMTYLDQVILESLRMYPLIFLERQCVKDYKVEEVGFVIQEGDIVQIPSPSIMKDSKYFENPTQFNPENFSQETKEQRNPYAFMAFGHGPRNCVGMRFALLQVKTAIIRLVANYEIQECSKTITEMIPDPFSRSFMPKGGIWIKLQKRTTSI